MKPSNRKNGRGTVSIRRADFPMEELSGVRKAGFSDDQKTLAKPLDWQVSHESWRRYCRLDTA